MVDDREQPWSPLVMKLAAGASILSAGTTLVLIFFPLLYPAPQSFADRALLWQNPLFQFRAWTAYVHPFLVMLASLGVWRIAQRHERGLALIGLLCMGLWAFAEALQLALTNVAAGWNWAPEFWAADPAGQARISERWALFYGLWDGLYFLLLTGFLLASLAFGAALICGGRADRAIAAGLFVIAGLSLLNFFAGYGGPAWTGSVAAILYPAVQPALRFLTGLWLWRHRLIS